MPSASASILSQIIQRHLRMIYPEIDQASLATSIIQIFEGLPIRADQPRELWSEKDSLLITYGNSIVEPGVSPLKTLDSFLNKVVGKSISMLHVLPFCPYSSDDGFSVIDYTAVDPVLGTWEDLTRLDENYRLMGDLVINHISSQSQWFQNYLQGRDPGKDYFIEADPAADYSQVVRPRATPLLNRVETANGSRHVWCTFSPDQVDLNFANPQVLLEMLRVVRLYLERGITVFRLDAIGYLWKRPGTSCIHLPETHEVVRLLRSILDHLAPGTLLITETNVPNVENLTYFGNSNEAHIIYNFSLAPLVVDALLRGRSKYLTAWMMRMPPAPPNCTYLNFTASHDGIGMRPAEGLISEEEQLEMVSAIEGFGGLVSRRRMPDGSERIYELNTSLFDALKGTLRGLDRSQQARFICSQTLMMGLEGLPAFYIHSLLATPNDYSGVERTGQKRSINRRQWNHDELTRLLADPRTTQARVCGELLRRIQIRSRQPAFHPHATQYTLHLKPSLFGFWRQSRDRQQSLFAVHNLSARRQKLRLQEINLIYGKTWIELISGQRLEESQEVIELAPYQCVWITSEQPAY